MSTIHQYPQNFQLFSVVQVYRYTAFLYKEETKTCYVYENATGTQICLSVHDTAESAALDAHNKLRMHVCTYMYVRTTLFLVWSAHHFVLALSLQYQCTWTGDIVYIRYMGSLVKFRPLRLLACIVIMPY